MRKLLYIFLLSAIGLALGGKPSAWDRQAIKNKAQLYVLASAEAAAVGDFDDYYAATMHAYHLDSTDLDAACRWGLLVGFITKDSAEKERAYNAMLARYLTDPGNLSLANSLVNLSGSMGRIDRSIAILQMMDSAFPQMSQPAQKLANAYLISSKKGNEADFDKAMDIYRRLEAGEGRNVGISSQKVRAYALRNDTASIIAEVDSLLSFAPQDPIVALFAGGTYEYLGDKQTALKYYDNACRLDSTNGNAFMAKANICAAMGDSIGYEREVAKALMSNTLEMDDKMEIFLSFIYKYYRDPAQEATLRNLFANLEQLHPGTPELHALFCDYLTEIGDTAQAVEEIGFAVDLDPENTNYALSQVQLNLAAGNYRQTISMAGAAMEKDHDNLYFPLAIALAYKELGQAPTAIALLDSVEASLTDVANPHAYANLISYKGDLQFMEHDTLGAIQTYEKVLDIDPGNALALNNAAYYMSLVESDLDRADQYSLRSLRLEDSNPTYLDTYAWIQFKKKDYKLAKQYIDMALNAFADSDQPSSADIYDHAGDIYFFNGDFDGALAFWKKALELDPDNELIRRKVTHATYFNK